MGPAVQLSHPATPAERVFGWELPQVKRDTGREKEQKRQAGEIEGHQWQPAEKVALWKPNLNL